MQTARNFCPELQIEIDFGLVYFGFEIKIEFGSVNNWFWETKKQKSHAMENLDRNPSIEKGLNWKGVLPTELLSLAQRALYASGYEIEPSDWLRNSKKSEIVYMLLAMLLFDKVLYLHLFFSHRKLEVRLW